MTQTAYPKVGGSTSDDQFRDMFNRIVETGATTTASYAAVGDSSGMQVKVAAGVAFIDGLVAKSTAQEVLAIGTAPGAGQSRIDTVVLQLDYTLTPIIQLKVIAGTAATTGSQVAPALTPAGNVKYNWPIADVAVGSGVITITAGNVTDRRTFTGGNVRAWTTASREASPARVTIGFNTTTNKWEGWTGSAWVDISITPGATGAALIAAATATIALNALGIYVQPTDPGQLAGRVWIKTVS